MDILLLGNNGKEKAKLLDIFERRGDPTEHEVLRPVNALCKSVYLADGTEANIWLPLAAPEDVFKTVEFMSIFDSVLVLEINDINVPENHTVMIRNCLDRVYAADPQMPVTVVIDANGHKWGAEGPDKSRLRAAFPSTKFISNEDVIPAENKFRAFVYSNFEAKNRNAGNVDLRDKARSVFPELWDLIKNAPFTANSIMTKEEIVEKLTGHKFSVSNENFRVIIETAENLALAIRMGDNKWLFPEMGGWPPHDNRELRFQLEVANTRPEYLLAEFMRVYLQEHPGDYSYVWALNKFGIELKRAGSEQINVLHIEANETVGKNRKIDIFVSPGFDDIQFFADVRAAFKTAAKLAGMEYEEFLMTEAEFHEYRLGVHVEKFGDPDSLADIEKTRDVSAAMAGILDRNTLYEEFKSCTKEE